MGDMGRARAWDKRVLLDVKQVCIVPRQTCGARGFDQDGVAQGHGQIGVAVHHDHVEEEGLIFLHNQRVAFVEHRKFDPDWIVSDTHPVATSLEARVRPAARVEDGRVGIVDVGHWRAGADCGLACLERVFAGGVHGDLAVAWGADHDRAHGGGVVAGGGAGPFEGELILGVEAAAPGEGAAQKRVGAGPDDGFVAGGFAAHG